MSTHFRYAHEFATDPATYWKVFFDDDYNAELYRRIQVKERTVVSRDENDDTLVWVVKIMPQRDLPGIIKKIVGGDLGYTEHLTYHKAKSSMDIVIEPTLLKDRTQMKAVYSVKEIAPGKVERVFEGDIDVDLPLVGRKVEATVLTDVKHSYDVAAVVTAEWLKR